jgi:hypothetical protein
MIADIGCEAMANNNKAINRIFTRGVITDLLRYGTNKTYDYVIKRYVNDPKSKTHGQILSEIYVHLGKESRNEYYYQNTLLNKLIEGRHSINTTTALSQIRIGKSIADFIMINGKGKVYEIKSDLDNFSRLKSQLIDYYKAFSLVSVLVSEHEVDKVNDLISSFENIGPYVGIYTLTIHDKIFSPHFSKEPIQFDDLLDHTCIFKLLRKKEYENVLKQYFKNLPQTKPVFHFRICLEAFQQIPILKAQELALVELKNRNRIEKIDFINIQKELKAVIYFSGLSRELQMIGKFLKTTYQG